MPGIPRRTFLKQVGAGGVAVSALVSSACASTSRGNTELAMYIGTYTRGRSRGIYLARFDPDGGRITVTGVVEGVENPSFLTLDADRSRLYAVSEVGDFEGTRGGGVVSFAVEPGGGLRELNRQPTHGGAPCHLTLDGTGSFLLVANYSGGNVTVLPIQPDGSLGPATDVAQHRGAGPNRQRQESPHAHFVTLDADNRFAFVADLGIDRVVGYRFEAETGELTADALAGAAVKPGAGPRHFAFHPDGRRAYVINELDSTLTAFGYHTASGALETTGTVSTLPPGYSGANHPADVQVAPSGRYLYGSNRGHDSIAVFAIDARTGALTPIQYQSTLGRTPRNFAIDPSGNFLIAANQDSDSVVVFAIDPATGRLSPVGDPVDVPVPVCVTFG